MQNWMQVLDQAARKFEKDTVYIFGHAAEGYEVTGTKDDLMKFRDYLGRGTGLCPTGTESWHYKR
jgi:hypothetical protein